MDRSKDKNRATNTRLAGFASLIVLGIGPYGLAPPTVARAQVAVGAVTRWTEAAVQTRSQGKPTILVVTSRDVPQSRALAKELLASAAVARITGQVNVAELRAEDEPAQIKRAQIVGYPTFLALRYGAEGSLELAGCYRGSFSPDELIGWVRGLGLLSGSTEVATTRRDNGVARAGLLGKGNPNPTPQASSQAPPVPMPMPPPKAPPYQQPPYYPPPVYATPPQVYTPPPSAPQYVVEQPQEREYEIVVEQPQEREYEVVVEQPQEREVVVAQPRTVVVAQPREVAAQPRQLVVVQPREVSAAPRNLLTRPAVTREVTPPAAPREVTPPAAPRTILVREAAPEAPRTVVLREAAPSAPRTVMVRAVVPAAPRTVMLREAAPAAPREVVLAAPRAAAVPREVAAQPALIQPGLLSRAVGRLGSRLATVGMPRVQVETETTYRIAPAKEVSVVTQEAPRPAPTPQPTYPPPAYYPPPTPPWAPTPQQTSPSSPQAR